MGIHPRVTPSFNPRETSSHAPPSMVDRRYCGITYCASFSDCGVGFATTMEETRTGGEIVESADAGRTGGFARGYRRGGGSWCAVSSGGGSGGGGGWSCIRDERCEYDTEREVER